MIFLNNYRKFLPPLICIVGFIILFFSSPSTVAEGVRRGLSLCGEAVIPSLFPFLVLSDYLVRSDIATKIGNKASRLMHLVFRLPGCCACVIFMSLIGGYPVGAKMTAQLFCDGQISERQARRMMLFCVNSGPAFTIGTVGVTMLSCKKCGIILFAAQISASLLTAFFSRFFTKSEKTALKIQSQKSTDGSLVESVSSATGSMLNICAWILLFSSFGGFLLKLAELSSVFESLYIMSEITGGCAFATEKLPVFLLAPVLSWAGLAVHAQLLPSLKAINLPITEFWLMRVPVCLLSALTAWLLFRLFPCNSQVFSSFSEVTVKPYSVSVPASVAMLLLGMFTVADIGLATEKKI